MAGDSNMDFDSIPIVDLAAWRSSDPKERQRLTQRVYEVCTQVGFFYIKVTVILVPMDNDPAG